MAKIISIKEAMGMIQDGMSIMIAGFLAVGTPEKLVMLLLKRTLRIIP